MNYKLKKISGDASFREFYRLQKGKNTSIIIQAKKEKFKNLITYIVVNKILAKNKIYAPKLITNHYEHDIIEISDSSIHHHCLTSNNHVSNLLPM